MAARELGVGIIGAGFMGRTHTFDYLTMGFFYEEPAVRIRLVGICDADIRKAERHGEEFGFPIATADYRELVRRNDIDIIDVCTPTLFHSEQILAAVDAGKHVYVDKPLCMSAREAEEILRTAAGTPVVKQVAYHYRFYPGMMKTKMLIDEGFLGKPISFRVEYYHASSLDPKKAMGWKQDRKMGGGGVLIEMGCHAIDLVCSFFGRFESLGTESLILYPERPDA